MCESLFVLRNCADYALSVYILGVYTGLRPALGQVGLLASDLRSLVRWRTEWNRSTCIREWVLAIRAFRRRSLYPTWPRESPSTPPGVTASSRQGDRRFFDRR